MSSSMSTSKRRAAVAAEFVRRSCLVRAVCQSACLLERYGGVGGQFAGDCDDVRTTTRKSVKCSAVVVAVVFFCFVKHLCLFFSSPHTKLCAMSNSKLCLFEHAAAVRSLRVKQVRCGPHVGPHSTTRTCGFTILHAARALTQRDTTAKGSFIRPCCVHTRC